MLYISKKVLCYIMNSNNWIITKKKKQLLHKKIKVLICQIFNTQNYELTTYDFIKQIH